jgi:DNA-binding CsgD family transcriptional regulator
MPHHHRDASLIMTPRFDLSLQQHLNAVTQAIYQTSTDPQAWEVALQRLATLVGAPFAYVVSSDGEGPRLLTFSRAPEAAAAYRAHCEAAREAGGLTVGALCPPPALLDGASASLVVSASAQPERRGDPSARACIGVHCVEWRAGQTPVEAAFALLEPHLRAALQMRSAMVARRAERALLARALDALPYGLVLIDYSGCLVEANAAARALLARGVLVVDEVRRVCARMPTEDASLRAALRALASQPDARQPSAQAMRLSVPDGAPIDGLVAPLPPQPPSHLTFSEPAACALLLHDPSADLDSSPSDALAQRFRLTEAEHRAAAALLRGLTIAEVAAALDITESTARVHTQRVYQKVGVADQAALIAALLRSIWMLRPSSDPSAEVFTL